ncbi:MAG: DUF4493 domain-containing protein [Candidatus Cryptobacteroides sp.]
MKNSRISAIFLSAAVFAMGACDSTLQEKGMGTLSLDVAIGSGATRAAMSEDEVISSARIKIYKADFSGLVREYLKSEMPSSIHLPADSYRIDVEAGEIAKDSPAMASWEQMSWKGSADAEISAGGTSSVSVTAKVCNAISSVSFDPSVSAAFENDYICTVGLSKEDSSKQLDYTSSQSGKDGFFIAEGFEPSLYWTFTGTLKKDGSTVTKSGEIPAVEGGKKYKLTLKYTETDGLLNFSVLVDDSVNTQYDDIVFIATTTGIAEFSKYDIWAGHINVTADVDESDYDPSSVYFEYRNAESGSWVRIPAERESEGTFVKSVTGLIPETSYEFRLVLTSTSTGEEVIIPAASSVKTDVAVPIPNGGMETTSNAESSKYKSLYDPESTDPTLQTKWWDSGNYGSTLVGSSSVICYPDQTNYKEGTQSMCLQSRYVVLKFAAGNLFSGRFGELIGTKGGTVYFGRPFTARPTGLRLWVKYSGGLVNYLGDAPSELLQEGEYDRANVRIALGVWDYKKYGGDSYSPVLVNTTDVSTFVDFTTDESTIAYGEYILQSDKSNSTNVWQQITIPLDYKTTTKFPTHIIISCASSMYGDYFAGYDNSMLWVDGFELLYE